MTNEPQITDESLDAHFARRAARLDAFMAVYLKHLTDVVREYPAEYCWPVENAPKVAAKMRDAIERGSYNHNSKSFSRTCKELGIKHTRKAIAEWLTVPL